MTARRYSGWRHRNKAAAILCEWNEGIHALHIAPRIHPKWADTERLRSLMPIRVDPAIQRHRRNMQKEDWKRYLQQREQLQWEYEHPILGPPYYPFCLCARTEFGWLVRSLSQIPTWQSAEQIYRDDSFEFTYVILPANPAQRLAEQAEELFTSQEAIPMPMQQRDLPRFYSEFVPHAALARS
jgi:hypothetical protein